MPATTNSACWRSSFRAGSRHCSAGFAEPGGEYSPDTLPALAAEYGAEVDFEATMPLVERHGLLF
jgi:hypothetical protein